ncbi:MAG: hypothetical protein C0618_12305 [Desulfuromonas sp.]|nr:MAG: hypothetical protein C0618_12305 [Desulfuromonas sp.]
MTMNSPHSSGFTLLELILIITLIGILAAVALPKIDLATYRDDTEANLLLSHLRYAQHRSMVTGGGWNITFGTDSYSLADENDTAQDFPGLGSTVEVTAITSSRAVLYFDSLGTPDDDAFSNNTNNVTTLTTITIGGQTFTVEPYSGGIL